MCLGQSILPEEADRLTDSHGRATVHLSCVFLFLFLGLCVNVCDACKSLENNIDHCKPVYTTCQDIAVFRKPRFVHPVQPEELYMLVYYQ